MRINENNYVDKAEKVIKELAEESKQRNRGRVDMVTTSKLRNLLAMTADIYNQVLTWQSESCDDLYKDKHKVEVDLAAERDKANAYQRENEILIRKIDSSLTVEELLRHLSKGGGNSVVIGIK